MLFEVKVNNKKEQIEQLKNAGINWVQPGIESLHDEILKKLKKGCSLLDNLQFLKWSSEMGIRVIWNIIFLIPGERDEWYEEMSQWLPLFFHYKPPSLAALRYDRFSSYFNNAEKHGLKLAPYWTYQYIYPLNEDQLANFAYYFQNNAPSNILRPGLDKFLAQVSLWLNLHEDANTITPSLSMEEKEGSLFITDTRTCATKLQHILQELPKDIYLSCDKAKNKDELIGKLKLKGHADIKWYTIEQELNRLKNNKLIFHINDRFFSLAALKTINVPTQEYPGGITHYPVKEKAKQDPYEMSIMDLFK